MRKGKTLLRFFILILFLSTASCKHDPDLSNAPEIHYSQVAAIISPKCGLNGCHGNSTYGAFSLVTYDDLIHNGEVKSGDARKSKFYKAIIGKEDEQMPPADYPQLSQNQIQMIYLWIEQGAKNN